jgi:hypothetical protein
VDDARPSLATDVNALLVSTVDGLMVDIILDNMKIFADIERM